ncbi:DUF6925 family protein [Paenirhodobacter sp.]|uniref:DUF6925 family protein n=1 Tax=Paenirhodobacter sp. TaxID=1965326 RepID=UPI003B409FAD
MQLDTFLTDPEAGWSMGSFGAICEFHHVAGDPMPAAGPGCRMVTARGGIRLDRLEEVRPVAWEALSRDATRWQQGVSLCLPEGGYAMATRDVLTELGPDDGALRDTDRGAILFDLGLAQAQVDFCIRTNDPDLIAVLRGALGTSVFAPGCPAMPAILSRHPARIALSRIGRIEVYQKIGGPETGGASPIGPHTHLLPQLMRSGRTHSANTPIPAGWIPVAGLHPASAVSDPLGQPRAFDRARFDAFAALLDQWGDPETLAVKTATRDALARRIAPEDFTPPGDRFGRVALRVALRQAARTNPSALLDRYRQTFDKTEEGAEGG